MRDEYNTCKFCKAPISSEKKYCDKECMRLHMSELCKEQFKKNQELIGQCAYCGEKFLVTNNRQKSLVRSGEKIFCPQKNCRNMYKKKGGPMPGVVKEEVKPKSLKIAPFIPFCNHHPNAIECNPL